MSEQSLRDSEPLFIRHLPKENNENDLLFCFMAAIYEMGFELYPAQEEACTEVFLGHHVILNTPTGSGKSVVALAQHFLALATGKQSYYTCPTKALANEKFLQICKSFGASNVGLVTGDATINRDAPVICCTAEILSSIALRDGQSSNVGYVVMDEFHFYTDPERGVAWQIPLLRLLDSKFLLLSATMGDNPVIVESLEKLTKTPVRVVTGFQRPVPLDFTYKETPLHETLADILTSNKFPIYVVAFSQRESAEIAQSLTSLNICSKDEKKAIANETMGFRFDSTYGKFISRYVHNGIGLHHAGLLPKYRLLVEKLAQKGLLKVICGTDTLGVGINIPIRSVVFSKLTKFDGLDFTVLAARDFHQIGGRAGRKGFDTAGSVYCQAPEHVIENKRLEAKVAAGKLKKNKMKKKSPPKDSLQWDRDTFTGLQTKPPETLTSRFCVSHSLILNLIQGCLDTNEDPEKEISKLIENSHSSEKEREAHHVQANQVIESLIEANILFRDQNHKLRMDESLQQDFLIHEDLNLYLLHALGELKNSSSTYALDVLSIIEACLENPKVILFRLEAQAKDKKNKELVEQGVPYEEKQEALRHVEYPKPLSDFITSSFRKFSRTNPWILDSEVHPKSIIRDMVENYYSFSDYIRRYGLARSEGVLLRYLNQAFKYLTQTIPNAYKDEMVFEIEGFLRSCLATTDASLLQEWESLKNLFAQNDAAFTATDATESLPDFHPEVNPIVFRSLVRNTMFEFLRRINEREFDDASVLLRSGGRREWSVGDLEKEFTPYLEEYDRILLNFQARSSDYTTLEQKGPNLWYLRQIVCDPFGDHAWAVEADIPIDDQFQTGESILELVSFKANRVDNSNGLSKASRDKRVDPENNKEYTFQELMAHYKGTYTEEQIKGYWDNDCKPVVRTDELVAQEIKKIDPEDGQEYTFQEVATHYKQTYTAEQIKDYWDNNCKPVS